MLLSVYAGDNMDLAITWTTSLGVLNLTGSTMFFTVKTNVTDPDGSALISKTWNPSTFTDSNGITYDTTLGQTELSLVPTDTNLTPGEYYYNLRVKLAAPSSEIFSMENAKFVVLQGVTQRSS